MQAERGTVGTTTKHSRVFSGRHGCFGPFDTPDALVWVVVKPGHEGKLFLNNSGTKNAYIRSSTEVYIQPKTPGWVQQQKDMIFQEGLMNNKEYLTGVISSKIVGEEIRSNSPDMLRAAIGDGSQSRITGEGSASTGQQITMDAMLDSVAIGGNDMVWAGLALVFAVGVALWAKHRRGHRHPSSQN